MKVFVINLQRDVQRKLSAIRQLSQQGIDFELFPAIEVSNGWTDHFDNYDEQQYLINTGRRATRGEIGCYASHKTLWKRSIQLNEAIMIMEDDFLLDDRFKEAVEIVREHIDTLHYIRLQSETRARKEPLKNVGDFTLHRYTKIPHSAMCYAVTPKVCQAFLRRADSLIEPVDVMIKKAWEHGQPLFGLTPYTVTESDLSPVSSVGFRRKDRKDLKTRGLRLLTKIAWAYKLMCYNRQIKKTVDLSGQPSNQNRS